ncbi:hypothetical protein LTR17_025552 [Elasticomyces elasticus]|nr:hypothetical protein LTR17_025552 [Elasticomyces elasticus]
METSTERPVTLEDGVCEGEVYQRLSNPELNARAGPREELRTTPLMTLAVKDTIDRCPGSEQGKVIDQYAVLGFHAGQHPSVRPNEPILMNVDAPNSVFICGSQGSGKSYTLNCILENCMISDRRIGRVRSPVAGLAFHYDLNSAGSVAETAYLCSIGVHVRVLVSQSNEHALRDVYSKLPGAQEFLTVEPLLLRPSDLSVEHKETSMPLYMSVALRVLRRMAIDAKGAAFDYFHFKTVLEEENLTKDQLGPLNLRLELLESFLDFSQAKERQDLKSVFNLDPGSLTIVDLTDPFMDPGTACILFDICLSLTQEHRPICGLVVALDEAHKYMAKSLAAANLTQRLLGTIREQRHNGTRVIVATQEPTISESLLDLCTTSIIHRFTSPAWFASIQSHLGAASNLISSASERQAIFTQIMDLKVGESLVFSPSALLCLTVTGTVGNLGRAVLNMKTRVRLGRDGGMSMLVNSKAYSDTDTKISFDARIPTRPEKDVELEKTLAKGEVFDSKTCLSEDEIDDPREQGVTVVQPQEHLDRGANVAILDRTGSHLVIICCLCEDVVVVEFPGPFLPQFNGIVRGGLKGGIAHATCVRCQLQVVEETKKASKRFDAAIGKEFYNGKIRTNQGLHGDLRAGLRLILGYDLTGLARDDHATYLFARVVQRSVKDGTSLWTARRVHTAGDSSPHIQLSRHRDGNFFKSSLRPNDEDG